MTRSEHFVIPGGWAAVIGRSYFRAIDASGHSRDGTSARLKHGGRTFIGLSWPSPH